MLDQYHLLALWPSADSIVHGNACEACNNSPMPCFNPWKDLVSAQRYNYCFSFLFTDERSKVFNPVKLLCTQLLQWRRVETQLET